MTWWQCFVSCPQPCTAIEPSLLGVTKAYHRGYEALGDILKCFWSFLLSPFPQDSVFSLKYLFLIICVLGLCMWVQPCEGQKRGVRSPGVRTISGYELLDIGAGNWTQILCSSSAYSYLLSHLPAPVPELFVRIFNCSCVDRHKC